MVVMTIPRLLKGLGPRAGLGRTVGCKHGSVYVDPFQPAHMKADLSFPPRPTPDHKATRSISKATRQVRPIIFSFPWEDFQGK